MDIKAVENVLRDNFPRVHAERRTNQLINWLELEGDINKALSMFRDGRVEPETALMLVDAIQCYHTGRGTILWPKEKE